MVRPERQWLPPNNCYATVPKLFDNIPSYELWINEFTIWLRAWNLVDIHSQEDMAKSKDAHRSLAILFAMIRE